MPKLTEIRRMMFVMMAVDAALLLLLAAISLRRPSSFVMLAAVYLPTVVTSNFVILRRKLGANARTNPREGAKDRPNRFSLYGASAVFFAGMLYGLMMISEGELPRTILPLLLLPLSLAVYCLKVALQNATRAKREGNGTTL